MNKISQFSKKNDSKFFQRSTPAQRSLKFHRNSHLSLRCLRNSKLFLKFKSIWLQAVFVNIVLSKLSEQKKFYDEKIDWTKKKLAGRLDFSAWITKLKNLSIALHSLYSKINWIKFPNFPKKMIQNFFKEVHLPKEVSSFTEILICL